MSTGAVPAAMKRMPWQMNGTCSKCKQFKWIAGRRKGFLCCADCWEKKR